MTRVYFVRHAQPEHEWEEDRTRPLTEEGKKDSAIVLEFLKDKKIDAFYCSPYKCSMDTIAEAADFFTKEIITDERLREREKGPDGNNHGMFQKRWADHNYHEEGGESIAMVQKRNIEALNEILSDNTDKDIVIGTHGTALSTILNFYDNSFGCEEFLRIIDWMPYIIELDFEGDKLVGKQEHCHVQKEFKGKEAMEKFNEELTTAISDFAREATKETVKTVETKKKEREKETIEDGVRDHLRGFSRTIPSFLMAYGDNTVTLATFDTIIPDKVFLEVTSITLDQFKFLRDGGDYVEEETGQTKHFDGQLFDSVVFDDSVKEFLALKKKLADYFDEKSVEDIFDYIPPQKTNQIFTPKTMVKKMVDMLEQENPGCFDMPDKTFIESPERPDQHRLSVEFSIGYVALWFSDGNVPMP